MSDVTTTVSPGTGATTFTGTLAALTGQTIAFKSGDLLDITDLQPLAVNGVTIGVTASYDDDTGALTLVRGSQSGTLQLGAGLTDVVPDPAYPGRTMHQEFTVRMDGAGGSLIGTAKATGNQLATALAALHPGSTGAGVTVGVISDSFNTLGGFAQDAANGYLTAQNVNILAEATAMGADEGREMARVVAGIAPGATIDFVNDSFTGDSYTQAHTGASTGASADELDMANAIYRLVEAGANVIVDDIYLLDARAYQPGGVLADAIAFAHAQGVSLLTSAGDQGNNYDERGFSLGATSLPKLGATYAYAFNPDVSGPGEYLQPITLTQNYWGNVPIKISWDQPAQASGYVLNVTVYTKVGDDYVPVSTQADTSPHVVTYAAATDNQATRELQIDGLGSGGTYYLAVTSDTAATGTFKINVGHEGYSDVFGAATPAAGSGTIYGHALDPNEIAVGAVNWAATPAYGYQTFATEPFSATGPGTYLLDASGNRLATPVILGKSEITGVDGAANDAGGTTSAFYGTSASAPSVAGVAALMLSANKNLTPDQVRAGLVASALPMAGAAAGAGLVQADTAVGLARLPTVTSIAAAATGGGPLGAGQGVTLTLTTSVPLTLGGGALPTLTLDDGGVAALDPSASSGSSLVFRTMTLAGQQSANLTVMGLALNGATLANAIGVQLPGSNLGGVPGAATGLVVDTTPLPQPSVGLAGGGAGIVTNVPTLNLTGTAAPGTTVTVTANGQPGTVNTAVGTAFIATAMPPLSPGLQQVALSVTAASAMGSMTVAVPVGVDLLPSPTANVTSANASSFDLRPLLDGGWHFTFAGGTQAVQLTNGTLSVGTDTNQAVVQRLYLGLLARPADTAGLTGFTQMLTAGSGAEAVAKAVMASGEYAGLGASVSPDTAFVQGAYTAFLGRSPAAAELSAWVNALGAGISRAAAAASFATSAEAKIHLSASTTDLWTPDANGQLVTQLYQTGLGRGPTAADASAWTAQLRAGLTPQLLAQDIAASGEFGVLHTGQSPADFVTSLYTAGLGRAPDANGLGAWTAQMAAGVTPAVLLLGIGTSAEANAHLSPTI